MALAHGAAQQHYRSIGEIEAGVVRDCKIAGDNGDFPLVHEGLSEVKACGADVNYQNIAIINKSCCGCGDGLLGLDLDIDALLGIRDCVGARKRYRSAAYATQLAFGFQRDEVVSCGDFRNRKTANDVGYRDIWLFGQPIHDKSLTLGR